MNREILVKVPSFLWGYSIADGCSSEVLMHARVVPLEVPGGGLEAADFALV